MLVIPEALWRQVIAALREPPHDRELAAYLDGVRHHEDGIATTLTVPPIEGGSRHFSVSSEDMSRAAKHLRAHGLRRLAQIHTHPGAWTGHSPYDDELAYSQRDGAISIVVPHFAGAGTGLSDCGVHVREPDGWVQLRHRDLGAAISIVPSIVDLRP
jgi:hypothetical protein